MPQDPSTAAGLLVFAALIVGPVLAMQVALWAEDRWHTFSRLDAWIVRHNRKELTTTDRSE